jgi:hypothetical protein
MEEGIVDPAIRASAAAVGRALKRLFSLSVVSEQESLSLGGLARDARLDQMARRLALARQPKESMGREADRLQRQMFRTAVLALSTASLWLSKACNRNARSEDLSDAAERRAHVILKNDAASRVQQRAFLAGNSPKLLERAARYARRMHDATRRVITVKKVTAELLAEVMGSLIETRECLKDGMPIIESHSLHAAYVRLSAAVEEFDANLGLAERREAVLQELDSAARAAGEAAVDAATGKRTPRESRGRRGRPPVSPEKLAQEKEVYDNWKKARKERGLTIDEFAREIGERREEQGATRALIERVKGREGRARRGGGDRKELHVKNSE